MCPHSLRMASCESVSRGTIRAAEAAEVAEAERVQQAGAQGVSQPSMAGVAAGVAAADVDFHLPGQHMVAASRSTGGMRLSSQTFSSAPRTLLGHLLAPSGDGAPERAEARAKEPGSREAEALPFFESKVASTYHSAAVADSTRELSTVSTDTTTEDNRPSRRDHSGENEPQSLLDQHWQKASHSVHRQQQQQNASSGQGGKEEVHPRKTDGNLHCEQPRQAVADQQRFGRKCSEGEHRMEDVSTEEEATAPVASASNVRAGQNELHTSTQKDEHSAEHHRRSTTTAIQPWGISNYEDASHGGLLPAVGSRNASGVDRVSSNSKYARANWFGVDKSSCARETEDACKGDSAVDECRRGVNICKIVYRGRNPFVDDSNVQAPSGTQDSDSSENGHVRETVPPSYISAASHSNVSDASSGAGHCCRASSDDSHRFDGDATTDIVPLPLRSEAAQSTLSSSVAYRSPCFTSASSLAGSAASPGTAAPVGRFRRAVGTRLSGMLLHSRSAPRLSALAKDGINALRESSRCTTVRSLSTGCSANELAALRGTDPLSPTSSATTSFSGIASKLPSPLLLRQLRRRALKNQQPCTATAPGGSDGAARVRDDSEKGTASVVSAGPWRAQEAGERTGESGRSASGVLRQSRGQTTELGKGRGERGDADSHAAMTAGGGRTAMRRRGGRRVYSAGGSEAFADDHGGQVKSVRFGSMSVHVYRREARIRSCSSDSLNFAVALDPADSSSEWSRRRCATERRLTRADAEDFDCAKGHAAYYDESEEEHDEEEGKDEEEEDEEFKDQDSGEEARCWWGEREAGWHRGAGDDQRADGRAAADEPHGLAVTEQVAAARRTGDNTTSTQRAPLSGGSKSLRRGLAGPFFEDEAGVGAGAPAEGQSHPFPPFESRSNSNSSSTAECYPSIFEDLFGRPDSVSSAEGGSARSGRLANTPVGWRRLEPTRGVALQTQFAREYPAISRLPTGSEVGHRHVPGAYMEHLPLLDRQHRTGEHTTATVAPALPLAQRAVTTTTGGGFRAPEEALLRETSLRTRTPPREDAPELDTTVCSSSVARAQQNGSRWWKLALSSGCSEAEDHDLAVEHRQRWTTKQEQPDEEAERRMQSIFEAQPDKTHNLQAEHRSITSTTRVRAACSAGTGCSVGTPAVAGETVNGGGGLLDRTAVADSREKQRFKIGTRSAKATEVKAHKEETGPVGEGNDINTQRTRSLKALFQKQIGWPELWTQNRAGKRDTYPSMEKGLGSTGRRRSPGRFFSDEYSVCRSFCRAPQRRQSEGVLRSEHREEGNTPLPLERTSISVRLAKETAHQGSGKQAEPVQCTNSSSPLSRLSCVHPAEANDLGDTHRKQHLREREEQSVQAAHELPRNNVPMDPKRSYPSISCCSTLASSTDLESKSNSFPAVRDLTRTSTAGYAFAELASRQEVQNSRENKAATAPLSNNVACSAQSSAPPQLVPATKYPTVASEQDDALQERQQQPFRQRHSLQLEELLPRRQSGSRGSLTWIPSTGRNNSEEEILSKAAEEAIARSATSMSAEEKENIKGILKGWCS